MVRFVLYYYSNYELKENEKKETKLTIETLEKKIVNKYDMDPDMDDNDEQPLECLIKTK